MTNTTQENIINALLEIEKKVLVNEWEHNGSKIWPLIRVVLGYDLFVYEDFDPNNQILKYRSFKAKIFIVFISIFRLIKSFLSDFWKNDFSHKQVDVIYLINSSTRYFKINDKWYNPYSDTFYPFLHRKGISQMVLELSSDYQFRVPRFRKSKLIQLAFFWMQFKIQIRSKFGIKKRVDFAGVEAIDEILSEKFTKYKKFDTQYFSTKVFLFEEYKNYYRKKLKVWRPKVVVCHGFYSPDVLALISVCNELKIKTIEIQHGVQGKFHIAYSNWKVIPNNGYDMLPNVFWTWTAIEKENIDRWLVNTKNHKTVVGGNPCSFVLDEKGQDISFGYHVKIEKILKEKPAERNIVFTAQAFFKLPECLMDAISKTPNWNWWIRIHPQYSDIKNTLKKTFEERGNNNVIIDEAEPFPLITLLKFMDIHFTEFSSSVLEAYSVGKPSIILNDKGINLFKDLIDLGVVKYASTYDEIMDSVEFYTHFTANSSSTDIDTFALTIENEIISYIK